MRMTSLRAARMFKTARPVTVETLQLTHLDMLQCSDISPEIRAMLGRAEDDIKDEWRSSPVIQAVVEEFNRRIG